MPVTGKKFIDEPFKRTFWFVAAQLGASEAAIGQVTGHAMREIYESNRNVGQLLAFPYHDRRGTKGLTLDEIQDLWNRWHVEQAELDTKADITLNHARLVIDPYLQHDRG